MNHGLCGRCLTVFDARSSIEASKSGQVTESPPSRSVPELAAWAAAKIADGWRIRIDDTRNRFDPVATFNGDPVCETHLWDLVDRDNRTRWGRA